MLVYYNIVYDYTKYSLLRIRRFDLIYQEQLNHIKKINEHARFKYIPFNIRLYTLSIPIIIHYDKLEAYKTKSLTSQSLYIFFL